MSDQKSKIDESFNRQNQKIFDIFNVYRLVLSLILLISFLFKSNTSFLGSINPDLFLQVALTYFVFNVMVFFRSFISQKKILEFSQFFIVIILDILILALISYTCGGIVSGMALLLLVPIAAGSILFKSKESSTFLAAVGTITIILTEVYLSFNLDRNTDYFFQAGVLGFVLFAISLLLQYLRGVIRKKEIIAIEQAGNIQSLEEMNYQIIQRMQTGIIVVNSENTILNANSAAQTLLLEEPITALPDILFIQLGEWKLHNNSIAMPFRVSKSSPQIQASFSYLPPEEGGNILIFLEDYSLLTSRVQHMKLMSLGRLTASIAHEVRNPLGAISHASQLLNESDTISKTDQRLVEIIETHSKRVNTIIENILQLSRNKKTAPELIPFPAWLEAFINKFSNSYHGEINFQLNVEPEEEVTVRFNQSQLEQVLNNLCDNGIRASIKHTQQAKISIRVRINPYTQSSVLEVIDEGNGIPKENEEKIFEPFFTTENTGTGLGLFICKEICEANQAQLSYRRNSRNQTCFSISFSHPDRNIT